MCYGLVTGYTNYLNIETTPKLEIPAELRPSIHVQFPAKSLRDELIDFIAWLQCSMAPDYPQELARETYGIVVDKYLQSKHST